jgi:hypothetical protein
MMAFPWGYEEKVVVDLYSFFLSAWDMKGCAKGGMMMMFVRMGNGALGHHEKFKKVGEEGGWNIMKKQVFKRQSNQHAS